MYQPSAWSVRDHMLCRLAMGVGSAVCHRRPFLGAEEARKRVLEGGWPWKSQTCANTSMSTSLYPLASLAQIEKSPSRDDGIPKEIEEDLRAYGCKLIHQAGILLKQCVGWVVYAMMYARFITSIGSRSPLRQPRFCSKDSGSSLR